MSTKITYRPAILDDEEAIRSLYQEWGYTRPIQANDVIWVAESAKTIVGVCRIAPEFGTFVFRGLYVSPLCRDQGIGSGLTRAVLTAVAPPECYCLPEPWLVDFYNALGFEKISVGAAPTFLAERMKLYRSEGYDTVLMRRNG